MKEVSIGHDLTGEWIAFFFGRNGLGELVLGNRRVWKRCFFGLRHNMTCHRVQLAKSRDFHLRFAIIGKDHGLSREVTSLSKRLSEGIVWNLSLCGIWIVKLKC
jgi:hypothetical protein